MTRQELSAWLRQQREERAWARTEMARQLIKAARANGDTSVPGVDSLAHNIYRWERGAVDPAERYKLCYCKVFGISPADFGADQGEGQTCGLSLSAADAATVFSLLADVLALLREFRREILIILLGKDDASLPGN